MGGGGLFCVITNAHEGNTLSSDQWERRKWVQDVPQVEEEVVEEVVEEEVEEVLVIGVATGRLLFNCYLFRRLDSCSLPSLSVSSASNPVKSVVGLKKKKKKKKKKIQVLNKSKSQGPC